MNIDSHDRQVPTMDDAGLQKQLAGEDFVISATSPILQHLLVNRDEALFSDEVIARVRGITANIAFQLLVARAVEAGESDPAVAAISGQDAVARSLIEDEVFVAHIHALTLEAQLAESIRQRSGVDHVLSLLIQHLTASPDEKTAALAIRTIAAQARFIQQMRRMEMPLNELPGDLFHKALKALQRHAGDDDCTSRASAKLRATYDEANSRLSQLSRLVMSLGRDAMRALSVDHAGLALFTTSLAMACGEDRNLAIHSFSNNQSARLAVSLRAAGLRKEAVEEQFLYIHPDAHLPLGIDRLTTDSAANQTTTARTDGRDWLVEADEPLASLQLRNGGELPGLIIAPALLELVRKARQYGFKLARPITARDEVQPDGDGCVLSVSNWQSAPARVDDAAAERARQLAMARQFAELFAMLPAAGGTERLERMHRIAAPCAEDARKGRNAVDRFC